MAESFQNTRGENKQMTNKIKDIIFYTHLYIINLLPKLRQLIGKINAKRIDTSKGCGVVKIHAWQLKLFKCVTDEDFYIVSGIYDALIKTKKCEGYKNFVFSEFTYHQILNILRSNYKWNEQTMFDPPDEHRNIEITWALGASPMSLKLLNNWIVIWSKEEFDINEYEDN